MIRGKFNVILDSAWGSSGKGKIASFLAKKYGVTHASSSNMPNAGHTVQVGDERTVYKVLPSASHFGAMSWIGPDSVVDLDRLAVEQAYSKTGPVLIHERAAVLMPKHSQLERDTLSKISSTMQGSGAALCDKAMRTGELIGNARGIAARTFRDSYRNAVKDGMALHEVSQGWGLSLDHGTHYPHCTSRNCGVARALDGMAVPPSSVGDVYLVVRTFPIRVGNTADGYSGDWLPDQKETSWEEIAANACLDADRLKGSEKTTVTKRQRRVATFSDSLLKDAVVCNGATKIYITFSEYIDGVESAGKRGTNLQLSHKLNEFVRRVERVADVPVVGISTGPDVDDMIEYEQ